MPGTKKEDKICPKCKNSDDDYIDESFSHLDNFFYFEYQCRICGVFWRRVFEYVGVQVRVDSKWID